MAPFSSWYLPPPELDTDMTDKQSRDAFLQLIDYISIRVQISNFNTAIQTLFRNGGTGDLNKKLLYQ